MTNLVTPEDRNSTILFLYNTKEKINIALTSLYKEGIKNPTQKQIAEKAGIKQSTISKFQRQKV